MVIALPVGVLVGAAGGMLAVLTGVAGPYAVVGFLAFALCLTLPGVALVFTLVVDRNTLQGAAENPEESIESNWYEKAAAGSFTDLLLILGVVSIVLVFLPADVVMDVNLTLPAVLIVCLASFCVRYLLLRHRG